MRRPLVDDRVRLTRDIPELFLKTGDVGIVRSTWFAPTLAYEVEFNPLGLDYHTRALLLESQLQVEECLAATMAETPAAQSHAS